jgi:hypothetical protein
MKKITKTIKKLLFATILLILHINVGYAMDKNNEIIYTIKTFDTKCAWIKFIPRNLDSSCATILTYPFFSGIDTGGVQYYFSIIETENTNTKVGLKITRYPNGFNLGNNKKTL